MPLHSLELMLDAPSDAWIRTEWTALAAAGLPSQANHRGTTNAPHVTLASASALTPETEEWATENIAPLLPRPVGLRGIVLLGRGPWTLARLLAPDDDLRAVVEQLRRRVGEPVGSAWLPHVTLARRLSANRVAGAIEVVATGPAAPGRLLLTGLRRWNPDAQTVRVMTGAAPPGP